MNHFVVVSTLLTFTIYQPSPVIIMETLFLRGIATFSNGKNTLLLIESDTALMYTADETTDIRLNINKGTIKLDRIIFKKEALQNSSKGNGKLEIIKNELSSCSRPSVNQKYDLPISFNGGYISGKNILSLEAGTDMHLKNITLQSPRITLFAKQYKFNDCFCDTKTLVIGSQDQKSLYNSIQFIFDELAEAPHKVCGEIDFETDSSDFIVLGIKEIKIQFSEQAFLSQGKPTPEIKPGGDLFQR